MQYSLSALRSSLLLQPSTFPATRTDLETNTILIFFRKLLLAFATTVFVERTLKHHDWHTVFSAPSSLKKETFCKVAGLLLLFAYSLWDLGAATESKREFLSIGKGGHVLKCGQKNHTVSFYVIFSSPYTLPILLNGNYLLSCIQVL